MKVQLTVWLLSAGLLLAACNRGDQAGAMCKDLWSTKEAVEEYNRPLPPNKDAVGYAAWKSGDHARWCIDHTAYSYARSTDPAEVVAKAVTYVCELQIHEAAETAYASERKQFGVPGSKWVVPPEDQRVQESTEDFKQEALTAVVESRAGHCWLKVKP
jgi:hypothetical protein